MSDSSSIFFLLTLVSTRCAGKISSQTECSRVSSWPATQFWNTNLGSKRRIGVCYIGRNPLRGGSATLCGFHTYVGADDMWVSCREAWVYATSLLCRHINVIKKSDFLSSISGIWTTSVFGGSIMWIASYTCCLFSGWALTFIAASRPPASVTNPRPLPGIKGNPHTVS